MGRSRVSKSKAYSAAESDRRDRLSELPDSLILVILSFLEMNDVVKTTILSKRWVDLWTTVPCLDFGDSFQSVVDGALAKWKGAKILKFSIGFWSDENPPTTDILDSWLLVPIQKQVEELDVNAGVHFHCEYYRAPLPLYSCSSITKLFLGYCDLKIEGNVNVQWNHLKSLTIECPRQLSQHAMNRVLSGAPRLEQLVLWSLDITANLNIRSTSLKNLEIGRNSYVLPLVTAMLKIWAPNLLSLEISACVYATCSLDVPSLTNATLRFEDSCDMNPWRVDDRELPPLEMFEKLFRSISHVEKVTVSYLSIQLLLEIEENYMIMFPNAKFLKLYAGEPRRRLPRRMLDVLHTKIFKLYGGKPKRMLDVLRMFPELMTLDFDTKPGLSSLYLQVEGV